MKMGMDREVNLDRRIERLTVCQERTEQNLRDLDECRACKHTKTYKFLLLAIQIPNTSTQQIVISFSLTLLLHCQNEPQCLWKKIFSNLKKYNINDVGFC